MSYVIVENYVDFLDKGVIALLEQTTEDIKKEIDYSKVDEFKKKKQQIFNIVKKEGVLKKKHLREVRTLAKIEAKKLFERIKDKKEIKKEDINSEEISHKFYNIIMNIDFNRVSKRILGTIIMATIASLVIAFLEIYTTVFISMLFKLGLSTLNNIPVLGSTAEVLSVFLEPLTLLTPWFLNTFVKELFNYIAICKHYTVEYATIFGVVDSVRLILIGSHAMFLQSLPLLQKAAFVVGNVLVRYVNTFLQYITSWLASGSIGIILSTYISMVSEVLMPALFRGEPSKNVGSIYDKAVKTLILKSPQLINTVKLDPILKALSMGQIQPMFNLAR